MLEATLRILLLAGSANYPSQARTVLEIIKAMLEEQNVCARLWNLAEEPLPLFSPLFFHTPPSHEVEAARRFVRLAEGVDAFVWVTPNYHNSFSGILKNALDYLSIEQCRNKAVALISTGKSERTGTQPCDQLRLVARGLHAVAIPSQVVIVRSDFECERCYYTLVNEAIYDRIAQVVGDLLTFARLTQQLREPVRS